MLEELRLNPRSPGARSHGRRPDARGITDDRKVDPSLSTGFAGRALWPCTGHMPSIHRPWLGPEGVAG